MSNILNILILDDNKNKTDLIQIRISKELSSRNLGFNYAFCECSTTTQALEAMKDTSFDILCLDYQLHAETGLDLILSWEKNIEIIKTQGHVILHSGDSRNAFLMQLRLKSLKETHHKAALTTSSNWLISQDDTNYWYENVASPFFEGKGTACHPLQGKR